MNNPGKNAQKKGAKALLRTKNEEVRMKSEEPFFILTSSFFILPFILLVTFICYHYTLNNRFINWDDGVYIYADPYIWNLSSANLKMILFHNITNNYYHPLTMLSLALNYHFSGLTPFSYYSTNIMLHLLNTALVFFLSSTLLKAMVKMGYGKIKGIPFWAGLCSLWQGIHPMHVESVSWIAERKDVLYLFFYLSGMLMYVLYVMEGRKIQYAGVILLFIFSLFSKPLAVVFPLSLLAIDILLKRDKQVEKANIPAKFEGLLAISLKLLVNKIPFLILSLIFGFIAYKMQVEGNSITSFGVFTFIQRITIVSVNYLMYLFKLFVPTHLSAFYPYPDISSGGYLPYFFYISPFLALGITGLLLLLAYKGGENYFRVALFGFAYYFFNVMFILQFVSSGPAIMADRYSYASYFGFVFMLIYFMYVLIEKLPAIKYVVYVALTAFSVMLGYLCQARTLVWHNSKTLWGDVVSKYPVEIDSVSYSGHTQYMAHLPNGIETAYKNLGHYYIEKDTVRPADYDSAFTSFEVLEKIDFKDAQIYSYLGNIWAIRGNFEKSLAAYTLGLKIDSTSVSSYDVFLNRGITYYKMGQYDLAVKDFNSADKIEPNNQQLYETRALIYLNGLKQMDNAIADYTRLIAIEPGKAYYYFNLSLCYKNIKDYRQAIVYAHKAKTKGYKLPDGYLEELEALAKNL